MSELLGVSGVRLNYKGLDAAMRSTSLHFEPAPSRLQESIASYSITLPPQELGVVFVSAARHGRLPETTDSFFRGLIAFRRELKATTRGAAAA